MNQQRLKLKPKRRRPTLAYVLRLEREYMLLLAAYERVCGRNKSIRGTGAQEDFVVVDVQREPVTIPKGMRFEWWD